MFIICYGLVMLVYLGLNRLDFKRDPRKKLRYQSLPLGFKLVCYGIVLPLFAGAFFYWYLGIVAVVAYAWLEVRSSRWMQSEPN